ncbi:transposase [Paenibacillus sp. CMAA1739]|uniref:transposase n=1 Tax=Paenibacillus ottowii TaxID=2315729 RepID=UPI0027300EFF|nr:MULTISPECIES: transposase [Paenibacillus]MDP1513404.1 transposase [Paenibacillus ottowii]MEC4569391.1 transposase [Paenibacillus sp. CMAA1739]
MERKKFTALEKLTILREIKQGFIGMKVTARKFGVSKNSIVKWRRRYEVYNYEGLEAHTHNRTYSAELKLQSVKDYLKEGLSQNQIIYKYKIASQNHSVYPISYPSRPSSPLYRPLGNRRIR